MLRIHSETALLLVLAADSIRFRISVLNRTGIMLPLVTAFANRGRSGFLGFGFDVGIGSLLLSGRYSDCGTLIRLLEVLVQDAFPFSISFAEIRYLQGLPQLPRRRSLT